MEWGDVVKNVFVFAFGSVSISGIIIYISKRLFETQQDILKAQNLHRFSEIYTARMDVIRELYKRLVKAEMSIEELMRPIKFGVQKPQEDADKETFEKLIALFSYYDENEIAFDEKTVKLFETIKNKFLEAWGAHQTHRFMETARGSEIWINAIEKSNEIYHSVIENEIPKLKQALKEDFQKRFQMLQS